jgi:hydrogenase maturation protease
VRVIGVGNPWRADDGVGLAVARRLRELVAEDVEVLEREGEPTGLIDAWDGADRLWLIDAVSSGATPGSVHRLDVSEQELPAELFQTSTHHVGLHEAIELARALGRLPAHVVVYGIEAGSFGPGEGLTGEVAAAGERVAFAIQEEVELCTSGP